MGSIFPGRKSGSPETLLNKTLLLQEIEYGYGGDISMVGSDDSNAAKRTGVHIIWVTHEFLSCVYIYWHVDFLLKRT